MLNTANMFEIVTECPCCGADKERFVQYDTAEDTLASDINKYIEDSEKKFPIIFNNRQKCSECGLIFMSPRLSDKNLSLIYKHWYKYAYKGIFTHSDLIDQRVKEFKDFHLKIINNYKKDKGSLLDVGCGSGLFISIAEKDGWTVSGIELDSLAAKHAKAVYNLDVFEGKLKDFLPTKKFDVITLFDYLEHTKTPQADLEKLKCLLKEDGLIFIRVPNQHSIQSLHMKEKWIAYISNHLFYFDQKTLGNMLELCGYNVIDMFCKNYITQKDIWKRFVNYSMGKIFNKNVAREPQLKISNKASSLQTIHKWIKKFTSYSYAFYLEELDYIGGMLNKGNNLMIIARKK